MSIPNPKSDFGSIHKIAKSIFRSLVKLADIWFIINNDANLKGGNMKRWCFILGIVAAFTLQHTVKAVAQEPQPNLIKEEMVAMNDAFTNLIQALIFNKPDIIEEPFLKVEEARKKVEEAIKKGGKIILPKNHSKLKEFVNIDDEYHAELEKMLAASKGKNMRIVKLQTHKLLNLCVYCHARFR